MVQLAERYNADTCHCRLPPGPDFLIIRFMNQVDDLRTVSRQVTKKSGSNFYYSFLFLPKPKREAIYAVYAFCRLSDDLVDESKAGGDPAAAPPRRRTRATD